VMQTKRTRFPAAVVLVVTLIAGAVVALRSADEAARTHVVAYFDNSNGIFTGDNVLIRFGLSSDCGMAERMKPILHEVISAYRSLGVSGWLTLKLDGLLVMLGSMRTSVPLHEVSKYGPGVGFIGNLRVVDFFSVFRGLGIANIGLLLLALQLRRPPPRIV